MSRLPFAVLACAVLCGCPPPATNPGPAATPVAQAVPPPSGPGCPAGKDVYIAEYMSPESTPRGSGNTGATGPQHTGWVLPLHNTALDSVSGIPEYAQLDATAATGKGVPQPPPLIWLMTEQGPCQATPGPYFAAVVDEGPPNQTLGVELNTNCPAPVDAHDNVVVALAAPEAPSGCNFLAPHQAGARLGMIDRDNHWQRPTQQTPIPPAIAPLVPKHDCTAPGCETLWSFGEVDLGPTPVAWAGAVNWLTIPPGATASTQCDWKDETFDGLFVAGPNGSATRVSEGMDHDLILTGVLYDSTAKILLAENLGEYTAYDLVGGKALVGHHLVWLVANPASYGDQDKIGPQCGGGGSAAPPPSTH